MALESSSPSRATLRSGLFGLSSSLFPRTRTFIGVFEPNFFRLKNSNAEVTFPSRSNARKLPMRDSSPHGHNHNDSRPSTHGHSLPAVAVWREKQQRQLTPSLWRHPTNPQHNGTLAEPTPKLISA